MESSKRTLHRNLNLTRRQTRLIPLYHTHQQKNMTKATMSKISFLQPQIQKTNKETNNLTLTAGTNLHVLYYDSASLDVYSSRALSGSFAATRSESVLHDMSSSNSKTFHFSIRRRKHVEAVGIGAAFTCPRRSWLWSGYYGPVSKHFWYPSLFVYTWFEVEEGCDDGDGISWRYMSVGIAYLLIVKSGHWTGTK